MPILTAVFVYLLQSDSGAAPAAPTGSTGFSALASLMGNIGPIAASVLVILLAASIYSWTIILAKVSAFSKATKDSRKFVRGFRKAGKLQDIASLATECPSEPLGPGL